MNAVTVKCTSLGGEPTAVIGRWSHQRYVSMKFSWFMWQIYVCAPPATLRFPSLVLGAQPGFCVCLLLEPSSEGKRWASRAPPWPSTHTCTQAHSWKWLGSKHPPNQPLFPQPLLCWWLTGEGWPAPGGSFTDSLHDLWCHLHSRAPCRIRLRLSPHLKLQPCLASSSLSCLPLSWGLFLNSVTCPWTLFPGLILSNGPKTIFSVRALRDVMLLDALLSVCLKLFLALVC